jgi:threonine/homoserine/homoserine lactone efflux protein
MNEWTALLGVLAALCVGVVSPGPSFVMVARTAVAGSRAQGLAAALGMGLGGLLFGAAALLGLQAVLLAVPTLYLLLKVLGGLYLTYLGWRIWQGADQALVVPTGADDPTRPRRSWRKALLLGFTTQVSNPKTAVVYASVFAAFMPTHGSVAFAAVLLLAVFVVEAGWYALVALGLSSARPRALYLSGKRWIDRVAGGVMVLLGLKLLSSAHRG